MSAGPIAPCRACKGSGMILKSRQCSLCKGTGMLRLGNKEEDELTRLRSSVRRLVGEYQKQASIYYEAFCNEEDQMDNRTSDIYAQIASELSALIDGKGDSNG